MNRRQAAIAVAVLVLLVLVAVLVRRSAPSDSAAVRVVDGQAPVVEADGDQARLSLFFPGGGGWLVTEERSIPVEDHGVDLRAIAAEVLAGPASSELHAPFPADTQVGSVFISGDGIAYVDLVSTRARPPNSGSRQEMLSVYSLVNSVHANLPDLAGVVLLWNGQQRATFAGHLDTGRPLTENRSLISR